MYFIIFNFIIREYLGGISFIAYMILYVIHFNNMSYLIYIINKNDCFCLILILKQNNLTIIYITII